MNDAFWIALPAIIAAAFAGINTVISAINNRKIDKNTEDCVAAAKEVVKEVKSATKEVSEQAVQIKDETASQVTKTAAELAEKQDSLEVAVNGRMDQKLKQRETLGYQRGLLEANKLVSGHTSRIEALETSLGRIDAKMESRFGTIETTMNRILVVVSKVKATATEESADKTTP